MNFRFEINARGPRSSDNEILSGENDFVLAREIKITEYFKGGGVLSLIHEGGDLTIGVMTLSK